MVAIAGKERNEQKEWLALHNAQNAYKKLDEFQSQYNSHFSKFTESFTLRKIETNETESLNTYINIWRYFTADIQSPGGNLRKKLKSDSKRVLDDFDKRMITCLKTASEEQRL